MDGTISKSLLDDGGLHLSEEGSKKLVKNLGLPQDMVKVKPKKPRLTKLNSSNYHRNSPGRGKSYKQKIQDITCWFCHERGHVAKSCWNKEGVTCYSCSGKGHKAKDCDLFDPRDFRFDRGQMIGRPAPQAKDSDFFDPRDFKFGQGQMINRPRPVSYTHLTLPTKA